MSTIRKKAILSVIVLFVIIFFTPLLLNSFSTRSKQLTPEEREVDQLVMIYYDTLRNVSTADQIDNIVKLFTKDAILTAPDGNSHIGTENIMRYYESQLRDLDRYDIKVDLIEITIEDGTARAIYNSKSIAFIRGWTTTTINPPMRVLHEKFLLVRKADGWKIAGLIMLGE